MITFACTVKDLFRRPELINATVRSLAEHGFLEQALNYALIRENISRALSYAAENMRDHEYKAGVAYLESRCSETKVAKKTHYTPRTLRRYIHRVCDLVAEYYEDNLDIQFLPLDSRTSDYPMLSGSFWEQTDILAGYSIENALVVLKCCSERLSVNHVCRNYGMGSSKVKRIVKTFRDAQGVQNFPLNSCRAV